MHRLWGNHALGSRNSLPLRFRSDRLSRRDSLRRVQFVVDSEHVGPQGYVDVRAVGAAEHCPDLPRDLHAHGERGTDGQPAPVGGSDGNGQSRSDRKADGGPDGGPDRDADRRCDGNAVAVL